MLPTRIRNDGWRDDENLQSTLTDYVNKRWSQKDIVLIMQRDFPQYAWSVTTLKRRLAHFEIKYIDATVTDEQLGEAVANELLNVGGDLGFRAMTCKIREKCGLKVKERDVLECMKQLDEDGVDRRGGVGGKKAKKRKEQFVSLVSMVTCGPFSGSLWYLPKENCLFIE